MSVTENLTKIYCEIFQNASIVPTKPVEERKKGLLGYKGFDKNLECRNFKYEVGKEYKMDETISLCNSGFHFCQNLESVDSYYSFKTKEYRFCIVEALGFTIHSNDKSVTNHIRIVEELSRKELFNLLNKPYWDKAYEIQQRVPNVLLGGSMALMLHGLLSFDDKLFHDIDFVLPHYITDVNLLRKAEDVKIETEIKKGKNNKNSILSILEDEDENEIVCEEDEDEIYGSDVKLGFTEDNIKVDFFIDPYTKVKNFKYNGRYFKVCDIKTILEAKIKYAAGGSKKHQEDLSIIFKKLKGRKW